MDSVWHVHQIPPVYDRTSQILILGSFPSVKSREDAFFYAHPQNRFWRVLSALLDCPCPASTEGKKRMLLQRRIALWDVVQSCRIAGSSDSSICDVTPNDLSPILAQAQIRAIYCGGSTAYRLYRRYLEPETGRSAVCLPSTSAANAGCSFSELCRRWAVILEQL